MQKYGKIVENDWKESASVNIAATAFEKNRKIKTYFNKQDKRPNLDGSLSIVENQEEIITVDVQIKTLPEDYSYKRKVKSPYHYSCNTNIFNVVSRKTTLNPVALVLVDISNENEKVFVILLTEDYVNSLGIGNKSSKVVDFSDEDILDVDKFVADVKAYRKLQIGRDINTGIYIELDVKTIQKELKRKKKHYSDVDHGDYSLVYLRKNIRGYLSYFYYDGEKSYPFLMLKLSDSIVKDDNFKPVHKEFDECMETEWIDVMLHKDIIIVNRSIQRTTASDCDVMNILYDIARLKKLDLIYYSAGTPTYFVSGNYGGIKCPLWELNAKEIEKEW